MSWMGSQVPIRLKPSFDNSMISKLKCVRCPSASNVIGPVMPCPLFWKRLRLLKDIQQRKIIINSPLSCNWRFSGRAPTAWDGGSLLAWRRSPVSHPIPRCWRQTSAQHHGRAPIRCAHAPARRGSCDVGASPPAPNHERHSSHRNSWCPSTGSTWCSSAQIWVLQSRGCACPMTLWCSSGTPPASWPPWPVAICPGSCQLTHPAQCDSPRMTECLLGGAGNPHPHPIVERLSDYLVDYESEGRPLIWSSLMESVKIENEIGGNAGVWPNGHSLSSFS